MGGADKLLLPYGAGPVVRAPVEAAVRAGVGLIGVVVSGTAGDAVAGAVGGLGVDLISNAGAADGISTSVAAAIAWADDRADALILLLGDEPGVEPMTIARAVHAWREAPETPLRVRYTDRPGHPVIVPLPANELPTGDTGLGPLLTDARTLDVESPAPIDVDDDDAYRQALARLRQ